MHERMNKISKKDEEQSCDEDIEACSYEYALGGKEVLADEEGDGVEGESDQGWGQVGMLVTPGVVDLPGWISHFCGLCLYKNYEN